MSQFGGGEVPPWLMMTSMDVFETPFATVNRAPPFHHPHFSLLKSSREEEFVMYALIADIDFTRNSSTHAHAQKFPEGQEVKKAA